MRSIAKFASMICAAGFAAALSTHAMLEGIAGLGAGAPAFEAHAHGSVAPVFFVELALVLSLLAIAVREFRAPAHAVTVESRARIGFLALASLAIGIAVIATATLFGMEVSESANAAVGFGWLGGSLFPGAPILAAAVIAAVSSIKLVLDGRAAGLERLIELLSKMFVAIAHGAIAPAVALAQPVPCRAAASAALGRGAGLRAPPNLRT